MLKYMIALHNINIVSEEKQESKKMPLCAKWLFWVLRGRSELLLSTKALEQVQHMIIWCCCEENGIWTNIHLCTYVFVAYWSKSCTI